MKSFVFNSVSTLLVVVASFAVVAFNNVGIVEATDSIGTLNS